MGSPCLKFWNSRAVRSFLIRRLSRLLRRHSNAWDKIEKSGSGFARPAYANATREEIAKHMIEVAGRGESDQHILAEDAVRFLAENYKF
jgi:hypothetical protein